MVVMYVWMTDRSGRHVSRRLSIVSTSQRENISIRMSSGRSQKLVRCMSLGCLSLWEGAGRMACRSYTVSKRWLLIMDEDFEVFNCVCILVKVHRKQADKGGSTGPWSVQQCSVKVHDEPRLGMLKRLYSSIVETSGHKCTLAV